MTSQTDPFDLRRFLDAQTESYDAAVTEISRGSKIGHWMWYVFPQIAGLGYSAMAERYAIHSLAEARAYLAHPILGPRLRLAVGALQRLQHTSAVAVFGSIDAMKLRSSLTLFEAAAGEGAALFEDALNRWFDGEADGKTLEILGSQKSQ